MAHVIKLCRAPNWVGTTITLQSYQAGLWGSAVVTIRVYVLKSPGVWVNQATDAVVRPGPTLRHLTVLLRGQTLGLKSDPA